MRYQLRRGVQFGYQIIAVSPKELSVSDRFNRVMGSELEDQRMIEWAKSMILPDAESQRALAPDSFDIEVEKLGTDQFYGFRLVYRHTNHSDRTCPAGPVWMEPYYLVPAEDNGATSKYDGEREKVDIRLSIRDAVILQDLAEALTERDGYMHDPEEVPLSMLIPNLTVGYTDDPEYQFSDWQLYDTEAACCVGEPNDYSSVIQDLTVNYEFPKSVLDQVPEGSALEKIEDLADILSDIERDLGYSRGRFVVEHSKSVGCHPPRAVSLFRYPVEHCTKNDIGVISMGRHSKIRDTTAVRRDVFAPDLSRLISVIRHNTWRPLPGEPTLKELEEDEGNE